MATACLLVDTKRILREALPLIDLRSPAEFARGAVPGAINLPLLLDHERAAVGTCYKHKGQAAAIALGEELIAGPVKGERLMSWLAAIDARPDSLLYCWRGGLRSERVQQWLTDAGRPIPRIAGGYKALRTACLNILDTLEHSVLVLGGRTGSGKTELLQEFAVAVDLEKLANHRGSAFGATASPQPTPISFENALAVELLQRSSMPLLLIEDEGRMIGRLSLPEALHAAMRQAPVVVLERSRIERAARIVDEYVRRPLASGIDPTELRDRHLRATVRISRRLGGVRHATIAAEIEAAFATTDPSAHNGWVDHLLEWYYDPMYDHQLALKADRIRLHGGPYEVRRAITAALSV